MKHEKNLRHLTAILAGLALSQLSTSAPAATSTPSNAYLISQAKPSGSAAAAVAGTHVSGRTRHAQQPGQLSRLKATAGMPADLRVAFENRFYGIEHAADGSLRAGNGANGLAVRFSGAETIIDAGNGARTTLTVEGYGWGSEVKPAGAVTQVQAAGRRLDRHYGTGLSEWFLNIPEGLEQGFILVRRARTARGPLRIQLAGAGDWSVDGTGDRVRLSKGSVTLDYAGLKAWDATGAVLTSRLRGSGAGIEIEIEDARAVYPLTVDPTWSQQAELSESDGALGASFGYYVALSSDGNTALVGAYDKNSAIGAVYVFTRSGATWTQQRELTAADGVSGDNFGYCVALSSDGNTALMGADGMKSAQGAAYVFTRIGATWTQQQELTASDGGKNDNFGFSAALSSDGNTALVTSGKTQGAGYVFTRSGATWTQQQKLAPSDGGTSDLFGSSAALSGDGNTALVGADNKNSGQGAAYVFTRSGSTWTQQQELIASDGSGGQFGGDEFGNAVALSNDGNTAMVAALGKNSAQGAVYVLTRSGATWTQQRELTASDGALHDQFGRSVALSADGSTALVGAPVKNKSQGAAYVIIGSGATWTQQQELTASDGASSDSFGYSVALSGDGNTALVGAFGKNQSRGAAYVFAPPSNQEVTVSSISFNPSNVSGGTSTTGTIVLSAESPAGGVSVLLASSDPSVTVPASTVVPAGAKTADFSVTTSTVANTVVVTVTATYNGVSNTAQLTLSTPGQVSLSSVSVNPVSVANTLQATGTVTLSAPAPLGGVVIYLWTNGSPAFVPVSITIPANATTGTFPVTTNYVSTVTQGTITAFLNGSIKTTTITVTPPPTLLSLSAPNQTFPGGTTSYLTVTLTEPAPAGGLIVYLWTNGFPAFAPTSITIAPGALSATFPVTSLWVTSPTQDTIVAFYEGSVLTATVTVTP